MDEGTPTAEVLVFLDWNPGDRVWTAWRVQSGQLYGERIAAAPSVVEVIARARAWANEHRLRIERTLIEAGWAPVFLEGP